MKLLRKLIPLFRKDRLDAEMAEEMRHHVELQTELNRQAGMNAEDARYAALRQFGNVAGIQEQAREGRGWVWLEQFGQDLRYAGRMLRKSPAFTFTVVATLAVGIGAGALMLSAVRGMLFRSLPFAQADRLVWVFAHQASQGIERERVSGEEFAVMRDHAVSFTALASINGWSLILNEGAAPEGLHGLMVRPELFDVLGIEPVLGRRLRADDVVGGDDGVMLISHELWQRSFGGSPAVLGRSVRIGLENRRTIIGVLPAGLEFPLARSPQAGNGSELAAGRQDFWIPVKRPGSASDSAMRWETVIGLLKPGVPRAAAQAELEGLGRQIAARKSGPEAGWGFTAVALRDQILDRTGPALQLLLGAVGLVLLLVCANVANLLLCRGLVRRAELALRSALGAGRSRVLRQLLTESLLLAALGGLAGVGLAAGGVELLVAFGPPGLPFLRELALDRTIIAGALGLAGATVLLAGIAPAWRFSQVDPQEALKDRGAGGTDTAGTVALRSALVIGQIALTVVLLSGAALLLRSFVRLTRVDLGYQPQPVLTAELNAWDQTGTGPDLRAQLFERLRELPWVEAAGAVHSVPLTGKWTIRDGFSIPGRAGTEQAALSFIGFGYFEAMGIPLLRGRSFDRTESLDTENPPVAIVNESFARRYFPGEDVLGRTILAPGTRARRIVGVVKDTRDDRPESAPEPRFYLPLVLGDMKLVVRTKGAPRDFAAVLRREIAAVDPRVLVSAVTPLDEIVDSTRGERRFAMILLAGFAGIALLLGTIGIYGVLAYGVAQRQKEIGIRLALGAPTGAVMGMIIGQGWRLIWPGLVLGLAVALGMRRLLESQLFGLSGFDVPSFVAAVLVLAGCALSACALPARRAAKVDPVVALRAE